MVKYARCGTLANFVKDDL